MRASRMPTVFTFLCTTVLSGKKTRCVFGFANFTNETNEMCRTVDDHTMFSVHAQVKYKKSVWGVVKGFIEKNTWAGLEDFYTALLRALQSEYCIPPAKAKGRRPRRGTT